MPSYKKPVTLIGPKEFVDFPELGLEKVPAKVDTGADSSAVWATGMGVDADGRLSFTLFGPRNRYYSRKKITTSEFRSTSVRNSFGTAEFRYKVRLLVRIEGRSIRAWFTLSDRSGMRYPVLLGRRLLNRKFVVDVSKRPRLNDRNLDVPEIAVFGVKAASTRSFYEEVSRVSKSHTQFVCIDYSKLVFFIDGKKSKIINTDDADRDVATYSQAYFKSHVRYPETAAAVAEYLSFHNVFFVDQELATYVSNGKLSEYMKLALRGLPIPPSVCASNAYLRQHYSELVGLLGTPFVLKEATSNRGKNNFLIASEQTFLDVLAVATHDQTFIAQKYIENDGFYRMYVLGKNVDLAIFRAAHPHKDDRRKHLNKPFGSVNASLMDMADIPAKAHDLTTRAAGTMNRQVAGVDILQDKQTKKWYILEVNNAPQLRSGAFVTEKAAIMARYFDKELRENL